MKSVFILLVLFVPCLLNAQGDLQGRIGDESNGPLDQASVVLSNGQKQWQASTDKDGSYGFTGIPDGDYELQVSYIGFQDFQRRVRLTGKSRAVDIRLKPKTYALDEAVVSAVRTGRREPATYTDLDAEQIAKHNLGRDLPQLLKHTPSAVTTSDAGAGVGYTAMRLRGTDQTGINVTINGIPLNDAESHAVFWVNLPDLASSVSQLQIQRGVGTSTNGSSAFGGSINILTAQPKPKPFFQINESAGSFKTFKHSLGFGTGTIGKGFNFQGRAALIQSDGYIDRASSDLRSLFLTGGYFGEKTVVKALVLLGREVTYQAWNGVFEADLEEYRRSNSAGTDFGAKDGEPYQNEVDDYGQDHYQLHLAQRFEPGWSLNAGLHYTRGKGFFEQYKVGQGFASYGLREVILGSDTLTHTDLIRRRWLDNHFFGTTLSIQKQWKRVQMTLGGAWNKYLGDHYGEVIWAQFASDSEPGERFYDNSGRKTDFNIYHKTRWTPHQNWDLYMDLQVRRVGQGVEGIDIGLVPLSTDKSSVFFNPKAGVSFRLSHQDRLYTSFALSHREPNRNDYIDARTGESPEVEQLRDLEVGYRHKGQHLSWGANVYYMDYRDQLVLTGKLNDVGSPVRSNADRSYRAGLELEARWQAHSILSLWGNAAFSRNKIKAFTETVTTYDETYSPQPNLLYTEIHENSTIAFAPAVVANAGIEVEPVDGFTLAWTSKYVGQQYLDNTQNETRRLDAYLVSDLQLRYRLRTKFLKELDFNAVIYNITNTMFEANGYSFSERYITGSDMSTLTEPIAYNYYYPQAGINFMVGVGIGF